MTEKGFIPVLFILLLCLKVYPQADSIPSEGDVFSMSLLELSSVKITAQKRVERIEVVPISVSSFHGEALHFANLQDVSRLELITPGLRFGESGSDARLSIRGSRTNDIRTGSAQVVGVFVDGVYMPSTTQAMMQWLDVSRVEVLRGPQGTLYGRNTFGGAINVWSNLPGEELDVEANLTLGNYNRKRLDGYLNIPIHKTVQFRLAGLIEQRDGYVENLHYDGKGYNLKDEDQWYLRGSLRIKPVSFFEAVLRISRWQRDINGDGAFGYMILGSVVDPVTGMTDLNGEFEPGNPRNGTFDSDPDVDPYHVYRDFAYKQDVDANHANLDLDFDFNKVRLKSITAGNYFSIDQRADGDLSNRPFAAEETPSQSIDFFQELQLSSNTYGEPFEWLTGIFYQNSRFGDLEDTYGAYIWDELETAVDHDNDPSTPTRTTGIPSPGYEWATLSETHLIVSSLFGQASYTFTDKWRITAGIRYNNEKKNYSTWWLPMNWSPELQKVDSQSNTWDHATWRIGLDYFFNKHTMLYSSISTGFRAGGFNTVTSPKPTYEEEVVTAYEIGFKKATDDKLRLFNIAAFYNDYRDMQSQELVVLEGGNAVLPVTSNAGDIRAYGLEAEAELRPVKGLDIRATFAFLSTQFGDYIVSNPFELGDDYSLLDSGYINLKGNEVPLSPKFSGSIQLSYTFISPKGCTFVPYLQTYWSGSYWTNDINAPGTLQEAYTKTDFRLRWSSPKKLFSIEGYIQNIENVAVLNRTIVSSSGKANIWANYMPPRTYGLILTVHFRKGN